ncbi:MAG TPA: amino-acid N-acetyltransferase [Phototrophicaceae bacterium]|nr:amino-acid N-acetyltransferase [Phototrophicaceae bacterium]
MSTTSGAYPHGTEEPSVIVRPALPSDARRIYDLVAPYAEQRILIAKELISYFEAIQEFLVAELPGEDDTWQVVGCGALHVMWDDIAEVRTLAVAPEFLRRGVGRHVLSALIERARALGLKRVFCLTFEVEFFERMGFKVIEGTPVGTDVYAQMLRSHDDGIAEFLDLARVKPNTLGNSRMLLELD